MVEFITNLPDDYKIVQGPCSCRINTAKEAGCDARDLKNGKLDFCRESPLRLDIQFGKCGEEFGRCDGYEPITKEECIALEYECRDMGLVSNLYVMFGGEGSICHCSGKTCVPLITHHLAGGGLRRFYQKGEKIALTDYKACCQNGYCATVCHFNAREIRKTGKGKELLHFANKCYGCGLCAEVCPEKAITMVSRVSVGLG
jgi:Pyruvate/2-oxoacid:ferredoxin oxidoreductase delta subunit